MNIDEMQAGGKLNCLIAEKLFDWEDASWDCECHCFTGHPKDHYRYEQVPDYSTDLAAAWEVVRKIQQDLFINLICGRNDGRKNGRIAYSCDIGYYENMGEVEWYTEANTLPLAICRAALKALGVSSL